MWCPYHKHLIKKIENVQKRFCKIVPGLNDLDYRSKLRKLNLLSLNARRLRYKLIFMFKMLRGLIDLSPHDFVTFSTLHPSQENARKLLMPISRHDYRRYFFTVDVVNHWNSLTFDERNVKSVSLFKSSIASYFRRNDVW